MIKLITIPLAILLVAFAVVAFVVSTAIAALLYPLFLLIDKSESTSYKFEDYGNN